MMSSGKFHSRTNKALKAAGDHDPSQCSHQVNGQYIHYKPLKATEGKKMVHLHENCQSRQLLIPDRQPIEIPKILPESEMKRLRNQGHVVTFQDRVKMLEEAEQKKVKLQSESDKRKAILRQFEGLQQIKKSSKLGQIESEAKKKNLYTLQRAFELSQEQEPDVKKATSIILAAKCKAIRDAQMAEKELMRKQMEEEERRLDMMMEQQRQRALEDEENRKQAEEEKNQKYVMEVEYQIKENEIQRLFEAERIEEESKMINKANLVMQREDAARIQKKNEQKHKMREDLNKANEEMDYYKRVQAEEDRIADLRIQEFMRKKREREDVREEELMVQKLAKEREIARLRAQQEKSADQQSIINEMNAKKLQEEAERAWREKEKAAATKRKELLDDLKVERSKQMEQIRRSQALELERDKEQFMELARMQKEAFEKDVEKKKKRQEQAYKHRKDLLKQIDIKERERINIKKEKFQEGTALKHEQEMRDRYIEQSIKKKVGRLRDTNLPEKYIQDVERQLNIGK